LTDETSPAIARVYEKLEPCWMVRDLIRRKKFLAGLRRMTEQITKSRVSNHSNLSGGWNMRKSVLAIALIGFIATPALADDVGVRVGPVGAGVTVGESHDHDRDRDRDHTTVIKERAPADRTTVIKKEDSDGDRTKTIIHHDNN
jgi:hypothetical protein